MRRFKRCGIAMLLSFCLIFAMPAQADFWGGDLPLLAQILSTTIQQLAQLQSILGTGKDTLGLLRDINRGVRDALDIMQTANATLKPGALSDLNNLQLVLSKIQDLYGRIPNTSEAKMQTMTDQTVAEAIDLHNEAFKYADRIDPEAERIKDYAHLVNPQGAGKLTAESIGVMIHVLNQILRTNAAILKLQSEQLALTNRRGKMQSEQFKAQYEQLGNAFGQLRSNYDLPSLNH
jgi:hypothetical protein